MTEAQLAARKKGGEACFAKYGVEHMSEMGRLGGRPRSITIQEVELALSLEEKKEGGEAYPRTNSLPKLKRLWAQRMKHGEEATVLLVSPSLRRGGQGRVEAGRESQVCIES